MNKQNAKWYRMSTEDVLRQLHTDAACGISPKAARSRLKKHGPNTLFDEAKGATKAYRKMLLPDSSCLLLLGGILLSVLFLPFFVSALMCVLIALIGFHFFAVIKKIKRNEEKIAKYRIPDVCVLRGRSKLRISARTVVPGDILILREGDIVPCDCRLLSSHKLRVSTLMPDEKGLPVYAELQKNCEMLYGYGESVHAPYYENMLYGGSEILEGGARAVAVETGNRTFLGAMQYFRIPSEKKGGQNAEDALREVRSYLRVYGFFMLALLLPLSIVGVLTAPASMGIPDIFFPLCLIAGMASPMLLMLALSLISLHAPLFCVANSENGVIFKGRGATDRLSCATDLFFTGHGLLSDGTLHFHSAALGSAVINASDAEEGNALYRLCEAFVLLSRASSQKVGLHTLDAKIEETVFTAELIRFCKYDTDALDIRLIHASSYKNAENSIEHVAVEMKNSNFTLLFSSDASLLEECAQYEDRNGMSPLSATRKRELQAFVREAMQNACRVTVVVRRSKDGGSSLIGILATREKLYRNVSENVKRLSGCGIRPIFFLEGDAAYERAFAQACGLEGSAVVCSRYDTQLDESLLEESRIFIGFPAEEISRLLSKMQSKQRRVGVLVGRSEDRIFLKDAFLSVATSFADLHKGAKEDLVRGEGREADSALSSATMRRRADVILPANCNSEGGLASLMGALLECRTVAKRILLFLSYLVPSHMLRVFLAVLLTALGVGLPGAVQILYTGGFLDSLVLFMTLSVPFSEDSLKKPIRIGERTVERLVFAKEAWLPILLSAGVFSLFCAILVWCGVVSVDAVHTLTFVETVLFELLILYRTGSVVREGTLRTRLAMKLLYWIVPILVLIPFSILVPPVGEITGLGAWSFVTLALLPILPAIYLVSRYFLSFFNRTAK